MGFVVRDVIAMIVLGVQNLYVICVVEVCDGVCFITLTNSSRCFSNFCFLYSEPCPPIFVCCMPAGNYDRGVSGAGDDFRDDPRPPPVAGPTC